MSNFAVIKLAGAQHLVRPGDVLKVNKLVNDPKDKVSAEVLLSTDGDKILFNDGKVELNVQENVKGKKMHIVKFRAKSRYRRRVGHRQHLSVVEVVSINGAKKETKSKSVSAKVEKKSEVKKVKAAPKAKSTVKSAPAKKVNSKMKKKGTK